ncbi:hypothetical protein GCM10009798_30410 [Nocardioides panacihumi]|uniref:Uncharacterized protein n=1 Tax=Nocardioides panacihumi TaxID=400774 RepID=A0ABN2RFD6_9ACTN
MSSRRQNATAGAVLADARGDGRALRVTWHDEVGVVVLSVWRDNVCTTTVRLTPADAVDLIEVLAAGMPREHDVADSRPDAAGA